MSTSYRDSQRYRKTYSFYRPLPRPEVMAAGGGTSDQALKELDWKNSVRAASTADISISSVITAIDGVTLNDGDRVLIKDQMSGAENGIYTWDATTQLLSRAADAVQGTLTCGAACYVEEGTQSGSAWLLATFDPITVGTTALTWVLFGGSSIFITSGQSARTIYSASFGGNLYPDQVGSDIFFYVSGSSSEKEYSEENL
jgi:phage-related tail fiber protein